MAVRRGSVEGMGELMKDFYRGKKVLVTGHTGFKGSWLVRMLTLMGAEVTGYALDSKNGFQGSGSPSRPR